MFTSLTRAVVCPDDAPRTTGAAGRALGVRRAVATIGIVASPVVADVRDLLVLLVREAVVHRIRGSAGRRAAAANVGGAPAATGGRRRARTARADGARRSAVVVRGDRTAVLAAVGEGGRVGVRRAARAADVGGAPAATGGRRRACSARADGAGRSAVVVRGDRTAVLAEARAEGRVGFRRAARAADV